MHTEIEMLLCERLREVCCGLQNGLPRERIRYAIFVNIVYAQLEKLKLHRSVSFRGLFGKDINYSGFPPPKIVCARVQHRRVHGYPRSPGRFPNESQLLRQIHPYPDQLGSAVAGMRIQTTPSGERASSSSNLKMANEDEGLACTLQTSDGADSDNDQEFSVNSFSCSFIRLFPCSRDCIG